MAPRRVVATTTVVDSKIVVSAWSFIFPCVRVVVGLGMYLAGSDVQSKGPAGLAG